MMGKEDLIGDWHSLDMETIDNPDGTVMYIRREAVFEGDNWEIFIRSYVDKEGNIPFFTIRAKGEYKLGKEINEPKGAVEIDFLNKARYVTPHLKELVQMFNETGQFDGEWMVDLERDVSLDGCLLVPSIESCPIEYDIIKVVDNRIYFGDFTAEQKEDIKKFTEEVNAPSDGRGICSSENRPGQLIEYPMIRK